MRIGILGGVGPEATGRFYLRLISKIQEGCLIKNNVDFPNIIINSINAPELVFDKIEERQLSPYIDGLKQLEKNNVDFIMMACNTIHLYYSLLQDNIKTKIIDLKQLVREKLENENIKKITVLGTSNTIKQGLYDFYGINHIKLSDKEINILSKAIFGFNKGINKQRQVAICSEISEKYRKKGSEIILGCTEIAVMLENKGYTDTTDTFIDYITKDLNKQKQR